MKNFVINPDGSFSADDVAIIYRNFTGRADEYNEEGKRNFTLAIHEPEIAETLVNAGYNVKQKEGDEGPWWTLLIKVSYGKQNNLELDTYLKKNGRYTKLNSDTIGLLDTMKKGSKFDIDVRPFRWTKGNLSGISAFLNGCICESFNTSRFAEMAAKAEAEYDGPDEL